MSNLQMNILITGASSGIGLELAKNYLNQGHRVFALARSADKLSELKNEYGELCIPLVADVGELDQLYSIKPAILEKTDHLDKLILNAGTCEYVDARHFMVKDFAMVDRVNWLGNLHCLEVLLPILMTASSHKKQPHLIGVSSLAAILPLPRSESYGTSKAALEYLLKSLQVDLYADGLLVTIVRPGFVSTPLIKSNDFSMPFIMSSEKAGEIIVKGIASKKTIIQFPFPLVAVMKLIAILPFSLQKRILQKIVGK